MMISKNSFHFLVNILCCALVTCFLNQIN